MIILILNMENIRIHCTNKKLIKILNKKQDNNLLDILKPRGIWYAEGQSWLIASEKMFGPNKYKYAYKFYLKHLPLSLSDESNKEKVLSILPEEIDNFIKKYSKIINISENMKVLRVNWKLISELYGGIEFPKYNKFIIDIEKDFGGTTAFYDALDCTSGCIWNSNAIKYFEEINKIKNKPIFG